MNASGFQGTSLRSSRRRTVWGTLLLAIVVGVVVIAWRAHYPVNAPLDSVLHQRGDRAEQFRITSGANNELLLIVTFSGGGTRAAAFAFGVLEALARTSVDVGGEPHPLLDEVDLISAVSGGSFTAAHFGLFGTAGFRDFEQKFLKANVTRQLYLKASSPLNLARLASTRFARSDLVAEHFDELLFGGLTYEDLQRRPGPAILLNATDIGMSVRFQFDQDTFDLICTDLGQFPVARAVAASSAVPGLLSAITLRNYAGRCGYQWPEWAGGALRERDTTTRRYHEAARMHSYRDRRERPFIHLLDGGLTDNLGVRPVLDDVFFVGGAWRAIKSAGGEALRKIAFIVVNAQRAPDVDLNQREFSPGTFAALQSAGRVPLDQYTFETLGALRQELGRWQEEIAADRCRGQGEAQDAGARDVNSPRCDDIHQYLVEVDFDQIENAAEREYLKALPTTLKLDADDVDLLRRSAARLLERSAEYRRLLSDLRSSP